MTRSWTITHWLAAIFFVAVLCSGLIVGRLVRQQEEASVLALAESRARAAAAYVFETMYASMRRGTAHEELPDIVRRLDHTTDATRIRVIRSSQVAQQYGETRETSHLREADPAVQAVLASGASRLIDDGETLRFLSPLTLTAECVGCHAGSPGTTVNGLVDLQFPVAPLKAPLAFLTDTAFLGFLGALVLILGALFLMVRLLVVRPIHALADSMARLQAADLPPDESLARPRLHARELDHLTRAFNTLMARVVAQREALEAHTRAVTSAKEAAEEARVRADAANTAKSEFLASMSHELRTPLNAILGFSEIIRDEMFGPVGEVRYRSYAADIHESGRHLRDLVNDLLDLARIEAGRFDLEPETFDSSVEITRCTELFQARAEAAGVTLTVDCADDRPLLTADRRALRQILFNLLSNAIKYTPFGGQVTVSAMAWTDHLAIAVADTGIGIDKAFQDLVFSAYGRVINVETRHIQGTGLGLSLVKALMDLHGGEVALDSQPGKGATFTLRFPKEAARPSGPDQGCHPSDGTSDAMP